MHTFTKPNALAIANALRVERFLMVDGNSELTIATLHDDAARDAYANLLVAKGADYIADAVACLKMDSVALPNGALSFVIYC